MSGVYHHKKYVGCVIILSCIYNLSLNAQSGNPFRNTYMRFSVSPYIILTLKAWNFGSWAVLNLWIMVNLVDIGSQPLKTHLDVGLEPIFVALGAIV